MTTHLWSIFFPLLLALGGAYWVRIQLFPEKKMVRAVLRAREVILPECELEKARENLITQLMMRLMSQVQAVFDLEQLVLQDIRRINGLMGKKSRPERELAVIIIHGLLGGLPVLAVPFLTGFPGYFAIYPLAAGIVILQKYRQFQAKYEQWQKEIIRDLPGLIDKLRISFASGRDYASAFIQARDSSGPQMRIIIDKLINDLQCMRPTQALDIFAESFQMAAVTKFTSAVKISIEYGYESAENYFQTIENDIMEVRKAAIEELTKAKPEKVYQLYLVLLGLATGSLVLKGWEIFSQVNEII